MRLRLLLLATAFPALAAAQPVASSQAPNLKVRKSTVLASKGMIGAIGDTVPLKATLTSKTDGTPVAGKTVSFKVAGKAAGAAKTGATGEAKLDYTVPNDPPPGSHPMEAIFSGDDDWAPAAVNANFAVFKASTKIVFGTPPSGVNEGETVNVSGFLSRITDKTGIHGREISMTVDGKAAGKVTTYNGGFSFSYAVPKSTGKKVTVGAEFEGDVLYAGYAASTEFGVKGPIRQGYLTWTGAKGKVGQRVTLTAKLTAGAPTVGPGIGGVTVRFWMDHGPRWPPPYVAQINLCQGTTNASGDASCSVNLDAQVLAYNGYAYADVDRDTWDVTLLSDTLIEIDKGPVHIAATAPASAHIGQTVPVKVRITRTTDGAPIPGADLTLGVLKKSVDANGEATFSFVVPSLGVGSKSFKVTFLGGPSYGAGEGSFTINVQPAVN